MSTVCRLCLQHAIDSISLHYTDTSGFSTQSLVKALVPELYLGLSQNPVVCKTCYIHLRQAYVFRLRCLKSENLIGIYIRETRNLDTLILLDDVVNFWKKRYENISDDSTSEDGNEVEAFAEKEQDLTSDLQKKNTGSESEIAKERAAGCTGVCPDNKNCTLCKFREVKEKEGTNKQKSIGKNNDKLIVIEDVAKDFDDFMNKACIDTPSEDTTETIKIIIEEAVLQSHKEKYKSWSNLPSKVITQDAAAQDSIATETPEDGTETLTLVIEEGLTQTKENFKQALKLKLVPKVATKRDKNDDARKSEKGSQEKSGQTGIAQGEPPQTDKCINLIYDVNDMDITGLASLLQKDENLKKLGLSTSDSSKNTTYFLEKFIDETDNSLSFGLSQNREEEPITATAIDAKNVEKGYVVMEKPEVVNKPMEEGHKNDNIVDNMKRKLSTVTSANEPVKLKQNIMNTSLKSLLYNRPNDGKKDEEVADLVLDENVAEANSNSENLERDPTLLNDRIEPGKDDIADNRVPENRQNVLSNKPDSSTKEVDEESIGNIMFRKERGEPPDQLPSTSQVKPPANPMPVIRVKPASALQKVRTLNHELWPQKDDDVRNTLQALYPMQDMAGDLPRVLHQFPAVVADGEEKRPPIVLNSKLGLDSHCRDPAELTSLLTPITKFKKKPPILKTYKKKITGEPKLLKRVVNPLTFKALEEMQKLGLIQVMGIVEEPHTPELTQQSIGSKAYSVNSEYCPGNSGDIPENSGDVGSVGDPLTNSGNITSNSGDNLRTAVDKRGSRDERNEDVIDIKEEPLNCTASDILMDFGQDDRVGESEGEKTRSASETSFMDSLNTENDIVKKLVDNIPEVGEEQYDQPEYVHINNVTFSDLTKLMGESKQHRENIQKTEQQMQPTESSKTPERSKEYVEWNPTAMNMAMRAVQTGRISPYEASKSYKVPKNILELCLKQSKGHTHNPVVGQVPVLSKHLQAELISYCVEMDDRFFGIASQDVERLANQLMQRNGYPKKSRCFDAGWGRRFLECHTNISPRTMSTGGFTVERFFTHLHRAMEKIRFNPARVYCVDQNGITFNDGLTVLTFKYRTTIETLSAAKKEVLVTPVFCMNAIGSYVPPHLVFPRKFLEMGLLDGAPPDWVAGVHPTGWIQQCIFIEWLIHFIAIVKPTRKKPCVLILDGNFSHIRNVEVMDTARINHIIIVCLPPNSSHKLQPLDVAFMPLFRKYYSAEINKFLIESNIEQNPQREVAEFGVCKLLGRAYLRCRTRAVAAEGFEKTGIFPFNKNVLSRHGLFGTKNGPVEAPRLKNAALKYTLCLDAASNRLEYVKAKVINLLASSDGERRGKEDDLPEAGRDGISERDLKSKPCQNSGKRPHIDKFQDKSNNKIIKRTRTQILQEREASVVHDKYLKLDLSLLPFRSSKKIDEDVTVRDTLCSDSSPNQPTSVKAKVINLLSSSIGERRGIEDNWPEAGRDGISERDLKSKACENSGKRPHIDKFQDKSDDIGQSLPSFVRLFDKSNNKIITRTRTQILQEREASVVHDKYLKPDFSLLPFRSSKKIDEHVTVRDTLCSDASPNQPKSVKAKDINLLSSSNGERRGIEDNWPEAGRDGISERDLKSKPCENSGKRPHIDKFQDKSDDIGQSLPSFVRLFDKSNNKIIKRTRTHILQEREASVGHDKYLKLDFSLLPFRSSKKIDEDVTVRDTLCLDASPNQPKSVKAKVINLLSSSNGGRRGIEDNLPEAGRDGTSERDLKSKPCENSGKRSHIDIFQDKSGDIGQTLPSVIRLSDKSNNKRTRTQILQEREASVGHDKYLKLDFSLLPFRSSKKIDEDVTVRDTLCLDASPNEPKSVKAKVINLLSSSNGGRRGIEDNWPEAGRDGILERNLKSKQTGVGNKNSEPCPNVPRIKPDSDVDE